MTREEIVAVVERMPVSLEARRDLIRDALAGQRLALVIVHLHAWRQRQMQAGPRWWRRWWR